MDPKNRDQTGNNLMNQRTREVNIPMNEPIGTGQSDEDLEQIRTVIRSSLEKTDKGGTANTIQNCITVFENDPLFAGKISRNLLTETNDMIGNFPWQRDGTRFDDQDLPLCCCTLNSIMVSVPKSASTTPSGWWPVSTASIPSGIICGA